MLDLKEKPKVVEKIKNAGTVGWLQQSIHRSRNEVFTEIKTITPALAEIMLLSNPENRKIRPTKLAQMVSDIRNGRWTFNGEAIIFAKTGELNDGQHRLQAVVEANKPVEMLFVFGVERDSRVTVDQGANRTPGDYLHMEGIKNGATLASVTRNMIAYERAEKKNMGRTNEVTAAQVMERATTDKTLQTSAAYAQRHAVRTKRLATVTVIGFCHNVLLNEDVNDGLAFMEQIVLGERLERGDPAFTARERLLSMETRSIPSRIEIILRAWNAYRDKRPIRSIPIHGRLPELS